MSLEKSTIQWSAKQIKSMVANGKMDFNHIVQRSYVWERKRKTGLIESMILGYPVPPIFAKRAEKMINDKEVKVYAILDGKQRLLTVKEFLNNEFSLTELPPIIYYDEELNCECEEDISNMKFDELPDSIRDILNTVSFTVTYFDNLTKEEERELFKRLNAGKPLSTKNKLLASCKDIEGLLDIGSHELFNQMLTEKARDNKNQVTIIMKIWCMLNMEINDVSFESKVFNPLVEETEISEIEKINLIHVFNRVVELHDILINRKLKKLAKKMYTETHLVSLAPFVEMSIINNIETELLADWFVEFFDSEGTSSYRDYNEACGSGSAKNVAINKRHDSLKESYDVFFEENENTIENDNEEIKALKINEKKLL